MKRLLKYLEKKHLEKPIDQPLHKSLKSKPFKYSLIALSLAVPQIPLSGIFPSQKAVAQTSCPVGTVATTVNWQPAVGAPAIAAQNLNAGGVGVRISFTESIPGQVIENDLVPFGGEVYGTRIDNEVYGGLPGPNLRLHIGIGKQPAQGSATMTITFDQPVTFAAPLTLLDVDRDGERDGGFIFQDRVTVNAFNGSNSVGVTLRSVGNNNRVNGNTVAGINENSFPSRGDGNATVTTAGTVTSVRFLYEPGTEFGQPGQDQTIGLAQFRICAPVARGSIGDKVYNDLNGNNSQDEGEPGLSGVTLNLVGAGADNQFGTSDDISQTTTTNDNGNYRFSNLLPGQYRVSVPNPPQGFSPTQVFNDTVNLNAGQNFDDADFGFNQRGGSIGDTVYNDLNGNSRQDEGEPGLPGVTLNLVGAGADNQFGTSDDISQTTTTNARGIYGFPGLAPGQYRVSVPNPPQGFSPTQVFNDTVNLAQGQNFNDADFGFRQQGGSIGDEVFNDTNGNGVRDEGEAGIPNAILILRNANGEEVGRTTTNNNGIYGFTGLDLGNYSVEVIRPDDFTATTNTTLNASLSQANPSTTSIDFGFRRNRVGEGATPNIRVVKRITNAFRNGQPLAVANFNSFNQDTNSTNDDALPGQERFVGVPRIETQLQSGDEVEYTVYFLTEGGEPLQNTRFCDFVPAGTTFINNSITVTGAGTNAQTPRYITPLTPLDDFAGICGGNNTNGAVVNNLGTINQNTFGFVRFRVGIN